MIMIPRNALTQFKRKITLLEKKIVKLEAIVNRTNSTIPDFLYDDGDLRIGYHGDTAVTDEWTEWLSSLKGE